MSRKSSSRIASALLALHGLIEITGLVFIKSAPNTLISFGGLTGSLLEQNIQMVGMFGALWGLARFIAAGGIWSLRKWALTLGIILSSITVIAAITIIPAGVADTLFALSALILLLHAWFGNEIKEII